MDCSHISAQATNDLDESYQDQWWDYIEDSWYNWSENHEEEPHVDTEDPDLGSIARPLEG